MKYVLNIARGRGDEKVRQNFVIETDERDATVATALRELNAREPLLDAGGVAAEPIQWECSCLQRKCGACAMLVDGKPRLACDIKLADCASTTIKLDPLTKFDRVVDLVVDRAPLFAGLEELGAWFETDVELPVKRARFAQESSHCLQCGCCLEVCPNFSAGKSFKGAAGMLSMTRLLAEAAPEDRPRLASAYKQLLYGGCTTALACKEICPAQLPIDELVSRSNAAAVWGRY